MNGKSKDGVTEPYPTPPWLFSIMADRELHARLATPRGRLEWLCSFGNRAADPLAENRPLDELAREIGLFMLLVGSPEGLDQAAFYAIANSKPELARKTVKDLSETLGAGLATFVDGGVWTIPIDQPLKRMVAKPSHSAWTTALGWRAVLRPQHYGQNARVWTTCFLLATADALVAKTANIRRCAGCPTLFVAGPKTRFHTKQCSQAIRVRRWRTKALEAQARRRKARKHKNKKLEVK